MLTFKLVDGKVVKVIPPSDPRERWNTPEPGADYLNRNDFVSFRYAEAIAQQATKLTGDHYVATDATASTSPRYDVVGDPVSYTFNGDSYIDGYVSRVSASGRQIRTTTGAHVLPAPADRDVAPDWRDVGAADRARGRAEPELLRIRPDSGPLAFRRWIGNNLRRFGV